MIALTLLACTRGSITTTELPPAEVGVRYSVAIEGERGRKARYSATGLPEGLAINPSSGIVSGVPQEPSEGTVTVQIDTPSGRTLATQDLDLAVGRSSVPCGQSFGGTFTEAAFVGADGADWSAEGGWEVIRLPVPGDAIEALSLTLEGSVIPYFVQPGQPLSLEMLLADQATPVFDTEIELGWNTTPNLAAYQAVGGELIVVLLSFTSGSQDWTLSTSCARSPVLETNGLGPFRIGHRVRSSFRATKLDEDISVEALDPLPAGLELSETGRLGGTPEQTGLHTFRIRLTRQTTGAETDEQVAVGVYEPLLPTCGETVALPVRGGEVEDFPGHIDPETFVALEAPWDDHVGLRFDVDVQEILPSIVLMQPLAPDTATFTWTRGSSVVPVLEATPQSWPPASHYQQDPSFRFVIGAEGPFEGQVTLTCDDGPRPAERFPNVLPTGLVQATLPALGGAPPYTWQATGLPEGLSLSPEGVLSGTLTDGPPVVGEVVVQDAEGAATTTEITWWPEPAACDEMLPCGAASQVQVTADDPYVICVPPDDVTAWDWVAQVADFDGTDLRRSILPPGSFDALDVQRTYWGYTGAVVVDRGNSNPLLALDRYDERPWAQLLDSLGAPTQVSVCTVCGNGATPPWNEVSCE
ncbi:MAG: putative Ig domain-containing protein [Myxococcales bacterium]|nr:putative Ig domain-containing protein [Myxococcales bacterium]